MSGWGVPHPRSGWGVPHPRSGWRGVPRPEMGYPPKTWDWVPPSQTWDEVPPSQTWDGVPTQTWDRVPPSPQTWNGVPPRHGTGYPPAHGTGYPPQTDQHSEHLYAAGGMPLAFMQEDFLVNTFTWKINHLTDSLFSSEFHVSFT